MTIEEKLIKQGWLKTPSIIRAFKKIRRKDFLPDSEKNLSELDKALPIGYGQTISQPLVVAFMLELLQPKEGERILDIGSGSGWTTALLAELVGESGKVVGIEIIPELKEFGEKNVSKYNFIKTQRAKIILGDGKLGFKEESPYDKILCSASLSEKSLPSEWKNQLKNPGKIVTPIGHSIWLFETTPSGKIVEKEYPGFVFVPLV